MPRYNPNPHPEIDKVVRYQPPTPSADQFSDVENHLSGQQAGNDSDAAEFSEDENHTASQQAGQDSDAEFSEAESHVVSQLVGNDSDAEFSENVDHTASQQGGRDPSESSLLKILASSNTNKDDDSGRRDHGVARLDGKPPRNTMVNCSRTDKGYRQCWRPTAKHHS